MEKLDVITNIRTEWISSALCTNQTPRSANVALQLGCYDGRAIIALPRSIGIFITSSNEADGEISVSLQRQLKEQRDLRFNRNDAMDVNDLELDCMQISFQDQRADDLNQVEDESVDVVISLQSADRMEANGLDWRKSVNETIRVLKPGGRLLFVERTESGYLDHVLGLEGLMWKSVGYDDLDYVLVPHIAGVAIKDMNPGLTPEDKILKAKKRKQDKLADDVIVAFESRRKKKRKKKKKKSEDNQTS